MKDGRVHTKDAAWQCRRRGKETVGRGIIRWNCKGEGGVSGGPEGGAIR